MNSGKLTATFRTLLGMMKLRGGSHAANGEVIPGGVQGHARGQGLGQGHVIPRGLTAVGRGVLEGGCS